MMTGRFRGAGGVDKLLRIARADVQLLRSDLEDIERVFGSTSAEIETLTAAGPGREGRHGTGALDERRFSLIKTLSMLEKSQEAARAKMANAIAQIAKLESLAAVNAREATRFLDQRGAPGAGAVQKKALRSS